MPPSVYLLVGSNPGLSDSVCVSFSDRSKASLDLRCAFSVYPPSSSLLLSSLSSSLSFSLTELRSSKLRAYTYIRAGVYIRTDALADIERGRNPSFPHRCEGTVVAGGKRTSTQTDAQRRRERSRCEIRRLFPPGFIHPSLSLFLFISLRPYHYAPARVYTYESRGA